MPVLTEGPRVAECILSEDPSGLSRDNLKIAAEQDFEPNTVLGCRAIAADVTASASDPVGTGNGVMTLADPAVNSKVKHGVYRAECIAAANDAGTFRVEDPDGKEIGSVDVGVAFNKEVKFTIANGATDFVLGDYFEITVGVEADDLEYGVLDPDATDGFEVAAAIALYGATTGVGENANIAGLTRVAQVNRSLLIWPDSILATVKAAAIRSLADKQIVVR